MTAIKQQLISTILTLPDSASFEEILDVLKAIKRKEIQATAVDYQTSEVQSFLEAAREYCGCIKDGPPDLSTNKAYLEGYGQ